MKFLPLFLSLFAFTAMAGEMKLHCEFKHNNELIFVNDVILKAQQKNLSLGSYDRFEFFISSRQNNKVELQIYDVTAPMRSYATADLNTAQPRIELSLWTYDFIVDAACQLQ